MWVSNRAVSDPVEGDRARWKWRPEGAVCDTTRIRVLKNNRLRVRRWSPLRWCHSLRAGSDGGSIWYEVGPVFLPGRGTSAERARQGSGAPDCKDSLRRSLYLSAATYVATSRQNL